MNLFAFDFIFCWSKIGSLQTIHLFFGNKYFALALRFFPLNFQCRPLLLKNVIFNLFLVQDTILLCCQCDMTFHRACLDPVPAVMPENPWSCDSCSKQQLEPPATTANANEASTAAKEDNSLPVKESPTGEAKSPAPSAVVTPTPTPTSTPAPALSVPFLGPWIFGTRQLELKGPPLEWEVAPTPDPAIPDASLWTPDDVQNYFSRKGFQEQASLLRQHVSIFMSSSWLV